MDLRECPFCGSDPVLKSDFKPNYAGCQTAVVRCLKCCGEGYIADSCSGEEESLAIDRWNIRTSDTTIKELVEALERYRKEVPLGHQPHMIAEYVDELLAKHKEKSCKS